MIIRKPTKIELKAQNDFYEYEEYKRKLQENTRNQSKFTLREELPLSHFVTPYQSRNRDNNQLDYVNFSRSNFVTPNNPQEFHRSVNQINASSSSPMNREELDVNRHSDIRNTEYINHLIQNLVQDAQTNNVNPPTNNPNQNIGSNNNQFLQNNLGGSNNNTTNQEDSDSNDPNTNISNFNNNS